MFKRTGTARNALLLLLIPLTLCDSSSLFPNATKPGVCPRWPRGGALCNNLNPACSLSAKQAQAKFLHSYSALLAELDDIQKSARVPVAIGPLVRNESNNGLVDIDIPLQRFGSVRYDVCGPTKQTPTVREAVVCTVIHDSVKPGRGNIDVEKVGLSAQGRVLTGARLGNTKTGIKVFITTQLHGDEPAGTEAALRALRSLTSGGQSHLKLLTELDILILVRANVDGGEPGASSSPEIGVQFLEGFGFFHQNVDPSAGGGFVEETEEHFFGAVGRGYDLNRYNYGALDRAIRPVESQAMVAVMHAFRPQFLYDLHGDIQKSVCPLDLGSVLAKQVLGTFPTVQCSPPSPPVVTLLTDRSQATVGGFGAEVREDLVPKALYPAQRQLARAIGAEVMKRLQPRVPGKFTRFSQIQTDGVSLNSGTLDIGAQALGILGSGWEVANFAPAVRPVVRSVAFDGARPHPHVGAELHQIEPCFLRDNICVHRRMLLATLRAIRKFAKAPPDSDNGWCSFPLDTTVAIHLPAEFGFGGNATRGVVQVPTGGQIGVPMTVQGVCPETADADR